MEVQFSSVSLNRKHVGKIRKIRHTCLLGKVIRKERMELFSPGRRSCSCFGILEKLSPLPSFGACAR